MSKKKKKSGDLKKLPNGARCERKEKVTDPQTRTLDRITKSVPWKNNTFPRWGGLPSGGKAGFKGSMVEEQQTGRREPNEPGRPSSLSSQGLTLDLSRMGLRREGKNRERGKPVGRCWGAGKFFQLR